MIVPASGHPVRCIPWVQMGTFNKEIGSLCGLKFFALNVFCGEYLQSSLHSMLQIWWKPLVRYCERCANKKLCASKHTGLLNSCLGKLCLHPYLVVPLRSARVTLISTRVSAHCQAILLFMAISRHVVNTKLDMNFSNVFLAIKGFENILLMTQYGCHRQMRLLKFHTTFNVNLLRVQTFTEPGTGWHFVI